MKKLITVLLLAALVLTSAFAYSNQQKIYSVDSGIYKAMETLYIMAGKAMPSSSGPWSEAELQLMLARIDRSSLSEAAQKYYDYISAEITSEPKRQYGDNFAMQFGFEIALQAYFHTDDGNTLDSGDWFHSYTERSKFLNFTFETWPTDNFYGYFEFNMANGICADPTGSGNPLYSKAININIPILNSILFTGRDLFDGYNWNMPEKAFVAAGGDHWSFMAGRDRLSWGAGETGNLMLSDSFPVHTMARFNTFFDAYKYSLVATIYPFDSSSSQFDSLNGYKALLVHRLEFNLFKEKVGLIINEACMFWSNPHAATGAQQFFLAQVNPFGFMHNEYIPRNANSLIVLEANYTPIAGLNVYGQFAIDEFSGPGEGKWNPAAFGFLAGVKGAFAAGSGIMTGSFEFVKTDPYLYIRGLHYNNTENKGYGFDAVYRCFNQGFGVVNRKMFTTYKYGNDVILFDGKAAYEVGGVFKVGFEAMFMKHGVMDIDSNWGMYNGNDDPTPVVSTPSDFNAFDPADYDYGTHTVLQRHPAEQTIVLSLTGEYVAAEGLSLNLAADYLIVKNNGNVEGENYSDFQLTVGLKYSI